MRVVIKRATDIGSNQINSDEFMDYVWMAPEVICEIDAVEFVPESKDWRGKAQDVFKGMSIVANAETRHGDVVLVVNRWGQLGTLTSTTKIWARGM